MAFSVLNVGETGPGVGGYVIVANKKHTVRNTAVVHFVLVAYKKQNADDTGRLRTLRKYDIS